MVATRNIEHGDERPRIFSSVEIAVLPKETHLGSVETFHQALTGWVEDWFGPENSSTNIATYVEIGDQEDYS